MYYTFKILKIKIEIDIKRHTKYTSWYPKRNRCINYNLNFKIILWNMLISLYSW